MTKALIINAIRNWKSNEYSTKPIRHDAKRAAHGGPLARARAGNPLK
jgi:hypothetical protein